MRLPVEPFRRLALALTASLALSGCAMFPGHDGGLAELDPASRASPDAMPSGPMQASVSHGAGPAADYPVTVGEPYRIGNASFTPADTLNYDEVGYVVAEAGIGVTASHHTLPLPSYVEVTSLDTGKTILVRVERRGPMTSDALIALSPMALNQIGGSAGTPVRVRRVNPQEDDRAKLRVGQAATGRMDTPMSLVAVLKRKLPAPGTGASSVTLAQVTPRPLTTVAVAPSTPARELPAVAPAKAPALAVAQAPKPAASAAPVRALSRPALPPLGAPQQQPVVQPQYRTGQATVVASLPATQPAYTPTASPPRQQPPVAPPQQVQATPRPTQPVQPSARAAAMAADGAFVVQVAALSSLDKAQRVAGAIGGRITQAGSFYRVRTGPFTTRGQAEASLAKVHAAGYSDARIFTNG